MYILFFVCLVGAARNPSRESHLVAEDIKQAHGATPSPPNFPAILDSLACAVRHISGALRS